MAPANVLTVLENLRISPPSGVLSGEKSFRLAFLDLTWLLANPVHRLCFYEFPHLSKSHFTQTLLPNLKHSLSITLQHFLPLAGNLIVFPFTDPNQLPEIPELRYVDGQDSVSLTIAECPVDDLSQLTGNHHQKADQFYPLVPKLGDIIIESDHIKIPVLAVQITLFPNHGICIGVTNHHTACDGKGGASFVKAWASITKSGNDIPFLESGNMPFLDRSVIKDIHGLEKPRWNQISRTKKQESQPKHLTPNPSGGDDEKVRATFILSRDQINNVKKSILALGRDFAHLSSFTITCGLLWACMAKTRNAIGIYNGVEDEREQFLCSADCRAFLEPPVPATYFGNCLVPCITLTTRNKLMEKDGVVNAIELIGGGIRGRLYSKEGLFEGAETWPEQIIFGPPTSIGVAGSPKFGIYDSDFGWGKPVKYEIVSIDYDGNIALSEGKDSKDNVQIGLALPKVQMEAFQDIFTKELNSLILLGDH